MQDLFLIVSITMLCMLSPGPDMVLVMRNTLTGGKGAGLATSLGVLTGNCVHIGYCAYGVGALVAHSVVAYATLKFLGAAYLIFLGVTGIRDAGKGADPTLAEAQPGRATRSSFLQGVLNNLLNPKGALFYLGVFTQVIHPGTAPARWLLLVSAMVATSALFWVAFVATLHLSAVRSWLSRARTSVERTFGVLLLLLGLRVATHD